MAPLLIAAGGGRAYPSAPAGGTTNAATPAQG